MKVLTRFFWTTLIALCLPVIAVWGLAAAKVIAPPQVVISGSMEPEIATGSVILAKPTTTSSLKVGDVALLPRADGVLVTHRVIGNDPVEGSSDLRSIRMKGDANRVADADPYVQAEALKPLVIIPVIGTVLAAIEAHRFELLAILAFGLGIGLLLKMVLDHLSAKLRPPLPTSLDRKQSLGQEVGDDAGIA